MWWVTVRRTASGRQHLGQPEVEHPKATISGKEDVLRLEIAMHQIAGMRFDKRFRDGDCIAQALAHSGQLIAHPLAQGLPLKVLKRKVRTILVFAHGVCEEAQSALRRDVRIEKFQRGSASLRRLALWETPSYNHRIGHSGCRLSKTRRKQIVKKVMPSTNSGN